MASLKALEENMAAVAGDGKRAATNCDDRSMVAADRLCTIIVNGLVLAIVDVRGFAGGLDGVVAAV